MKKITFLLFAALCLAFASTADAHDFEVGGIYYNITSYDEPYTVEVTYSGTSAGETAEYSGNVTIPATVTHSGYEITYSVTAVGASAFQGNTGLTSVTIPVGVTYLGVGAFVSCTALENVSLPEGLISMGNCCFQYCSALRSITIPNSVTALSDDDNNGVDDDNLIGAAFMGCKGLKEVTIGAKITNLVFNNGLFNTDADRGELEKVTCYAATPPAIDGNTFLIGIDNARLYVPEASISTYAATAHWSSFATNQQNNESWGAGIYPIPPACPSPTDFLVNSSGTLTWTGSAASYKLIVSTTEPKDPDGLADYAGPVYDISANTSDLSSLITLENQTTYYIYLQSDCSEDGTSEWVSTSLLYETCPPPTSFTADKVSGYLTWISDVGAYNIIVSETELDEIGLANASSVNTNDTCYDPSSALITENTTYYFYLRSECGGGKTSEWTSTSFHYARFKEGDIYYRITAPETVEVTYGGNSAAATTSEYTGEVTIPATVIHNQTTYNVTAVGASAFQGNIGLTSVTIPVGVTYLGVGAFVSCTALENVSLPEGLISMGNCCFQYCSALRSITIPNSVTALSDDDNNGVDDGNLIGAAFMGCKGLKEVTIGASITNLAFANGLFNTNADPGELEKVTCYAATPPAIDGNTFLIGISSASLYVPEASIGTYIAAGYWSSFATNQQNSESWGAGIYPIPDPDACTPPDYFTVEMFTGKLIRSGGEEEEYNIIVSATELDTDGLANYSPENIIHTTENIYILSDSLTLQNETTYYVYLQKDCGAGKTSEWLSTLFYYYTGKICEWTVFGGDYYYSQDPANPSAGFGFGSDKVGLEFWQKNMLIARVMGDVSFLSPTITLIDGESVTIEWIGNANSGYNDENSIYVTDGDGNKIIDGITKYEQESATLGTFSVNCSGCASPTGFSENPINSNLTWAGNAVSYNIIVSKTALDSAGLADYAGTVYNITGANTFDLSDSITLEDKTMYYIYLQSDCGEGKTSEWVGASLLYETCPPPTSFTADKVSGYLTWISDVGAYNMIISNAELDENGLATYPGTVINTIDTCYDPSSALTTENTTYYFYLRSDCGEGKTSEWASTSFHYARFKEGDIYYRITASETVEVTYGGINPTAINEYTGEVTIPATVTHNLTTYSVTAVGANAFEGNTGLTSVTLPVSVTYLGTRAFAGCTALGAITLHEGLISMGSCCFQYCSALTSITIPNSVTALWDNNNDGVNDENDGATFMGCTGLKEVTVGAKITDVAAPNVLFNGVENIEKITCFATAPPASMWNGYFAFNWVTGSNCRLYVPEVSVGDYIIAAGWSRFATNQQNENSHGAGIYPIPPACASPTEFSANVINGNLTWTGNAALYNIIVSKTALDSAALADYADTVYDISANTSDLSDLVTLEDKTTYYIYLRSDCGEGETSEWVSTSFYNTADVKFFEVDGIYYRVTSNETVEVTFNGATPDSVQEYSGNITVPAQVEYNTERYNVTAVGAGAFQGNTGLDTVVLSAGITYLGANAFQGCSGLKNITLPEGLISMGSTCFQFDTSLTSIVIPNSVVALWDDNGDGVNDVSAAGGAFYGCTGLREVTVGSGINDISAPNVLFNGLVNLTKVTCLATAPPADSWNGYSAFNWVDFSNCALFVPAGSVNDYVNATGWWRFATTEQDPYSEAIGAGIYEVGTCVPPRNLTAEQLSGYLTWTGYAYTEGYNIIVSATELDSAALAAYPAGNIVKTSETEYDPSALTLESEATYYVYVQGDCGSGGTGKWVSASFYYYTDSTCEWTVFGGDYWQATPSSPNYGFGYDNNSVGLEFWQRDILIAEVKGQVSLDHPTVTLIDGESVTIEWIGTGIYEDDNSIYVTDGSGTPIINGVIKKDNASERLGTFDVSCTGGIVTDIEKPATTKIIVVPTLSNGFVTVSGAEAGSTVKVVDSRGRVLKSETVAGDRRIELNYTNGLYFIVVRSGNRVVTEKVILKR